MRGIFNSKFPPSVRMRGFLSQICANQPANLCKTNLVQPEYLCSLTKEGLGHNLREIFAE